jgi:hypothetical protein
VGTLEWFRWGLSTGTSGSFGLESMGTLIGIRTHIIKYSGNSVGLSIFLSIISCFFEVPILNSVAVTGMLRSKISSEIGLVDSILGKVNNFLINKNSRINRIIIPDVRYLQGESTINRRILYDLLSKLEIMRNTGTVSNVLILCKSVFETFKYILESRNYESLIYKIKFNALCSFEDLSDDFFHGDGNIFCSNKDILEEIDEEIRIKIAVTRLYLIGYSENFTNGLFQKSIRNQRERKESQEELNRRRIQSKKMKKKLEKERIEEREKRLKWFENEKREYEDIICQFKRDREMDEESLSSFKSDKFGDFDKKLFASNKEILKSLQKQLEMTVNSIKRIKNHDS